MQHTTPTVFIVGGPTRDELRLATFEPRTVNSGIVSFTLEGGETIEVRIGMVGPESGDGESWLIKGDIPGTTRVVGGTRTASTTVDGYYNTHHNTGHLRWEETH